MSRVPGRWWRGPGRCGGVVGRRGPLEARRVALEGRRSRHPVGRAVLGRTIGAAVDSTVVGHGGEHRWGRRRRRAPGPVVRPHLDGTRPWVCEGRVGARWCGACRCRRATASTAAATAAVALSAAAVVRRAASGVGRERCTRRTCRRRCRRSLTRWWSRRVGDESGGR